MTSDVLDQPQRIVDGRVGIACRHRVADPEQLEAALRVGHDILGFAGDQIVLFHRAVIARMWAQFEVQIVQGRVPWLTTT